MQDGGELVERRLVAGTPGADLLVCDPRIQLGGDIASGMTQGFNRPCVPVGVQVGLAILWRRKTDTIAASVLVIGRMQQLMQIADEVNQELQGEEPFRR